MGLGPKFSSGSYDAPTTGNPDPRKFTILKSQQYGPHFCVIKIQYPNCTNYEGVKILVFKELLAHVLTSEMIDPHFMENSKRPSPIARFQPTDEGWADALSYCSFKNAQTHIRGGI
jgi:hypothetical protein